MKITVYGTTTKGQQLIVSDIHRYLKQAGVDFELVEEANIDVILKKSLRSIPAIELESGEVFYVKNNSSVRRSVRRVVKRILSPLSYAGLPVLITPFDFGEQALQLLASAHYLGARTGSVIKIYVNIEQFIPSTFQNRREIKDELNELITKMNQRLIGLNSPLVDYVLADEPIEKYVLRYDNIHNPPVVIDFIHTERAMTGNAFPMLSKILIPESGRIKFNKCWVLESLGEELLTNRFFQSLSLESVETFDQSKMPASLLGSLVVVNREFFKKYSKKLIGMNALVFIP